MSIVAGIWAFTTPLFGAPDEPAHVIRAAAIVRGELVGTTREGEPDFVRDVSVPAIFGSVTVPYAPEPRYSTVCFAFDRNVTPDCLSFTGSKDTKAISTGLTRFPPFYYGIVGPASLGLASVSGVLLMRVATVLICAALVACAYVSLRRPPNPRIALLGLSVAVTPMLLFLFGSVNPSALEIAAGVALWSAAGVLVFEAPARIDHRLVGMTGIAASLLVLSRSLAPLWLALTGLTMVAVAPAGSLRRIARDTTCRVWGLIVVAASVAQLTWTVVVAPLDLVTREAVDADTSELVRGSLGKTDFSYQQMIGVFGWVDTPAPFLSVLFWTIILGTVVVLAITCGRRRECLALVGLVAAVVFVPVVLESAQAGDVGFVWQGRHTLPLAVGVPILAGLMLAFDERDRDFLARGRIYVLSGVALFFAHFLAYAQYLRRNMVGYDGPLQFWRDPDWSPLLSAWLSVPAYAFAIAGLLLWLLGPAAVGLPRREVRT